MRRGEGSVRGGAREGLGGWGEDETGRLIMGMFWGKGDGQD